MRQRYNQSTDKDKEYAAIIEEYKLNKIPIPGLEYNYLTNVWGPVMLGGIPDKPKIWEQRPGQWIVFVGERQLNQPPFTNEKDAQQAAIEYFNKLEKM